MILAAFTDAADSWEEITAPSDRNALDEDDAVLDPDSYDRLLFDDSTFSLIAALLWAADTLATFQDTIEIC